MEKLVGNLSNSVRKKAADPANLTEEDTTQLTRQLKPELLQASRLRRRMKRDLLLKVEEEQQKVVRLQHHHHQRSLSANSARNLFQSSPSMNSIDEYGSVGAEERDDSY